MRVLVETVSVEKLVEHDALGWEAMIAIILIVFVPELVKTNSISAKSIVLLLDIELSHLRL